MGDMKASLQPLTCELVVTNLIDSRPDASIFQDGLNLLGAEVGDPNASDQAPVHQVLHGRPGLAEGGYHLWPRLLRVGPG